MNNDYKNLISEIVNGIKKIINEGISSRLFHFCPLNSMYQIAKTDSFKLTPVEEKGPRNKVMTSLPMGNGKVKQYNYYMCFSRTPSSLVGYVGMRRNYTGGKTWKQTIVRIEVDGEKIMANYKGMPVDYYINKNDPKIDHYYEFDDDKNKINTVKGRYGNEYSKRMFVNTLTPDGKIKQRQINRYTPHADDKLDPRGKKKSQVTVDYGVIDRNQTREYEDRIFSNKEFITNIKERGYIKRIDIYISKNVLNRKTDFSNDAFFMIDEILKIFGNLVHIYDNFSSFESMNINKSLPIGEKIKDKYMELSQNDYLSTHSQINKENLSLSQKELGTLVKYAVVLGFYGNYNQNWKGVTFDNTLYILQKNNIDTNNSYVIEIVNKLISAIERVGKRFFSIQTSQLVKELEEIPPYKKEVYVNGMDKIKNKQEIAYYNRTGIKRKLIGIKISFCKY